MSRHALNTKDRPESYVINPVYLLVIIFLSIFVAEAVIMIVLNMLPPLSMFQDVMVDSLSLIIITSPILYLFAFKPLKKQIIYCEEAEAEKDILIEELKASIAEVKTLQGIIPICASCKNIRDDKGFWHKVEAYVENQTDALFSHGVCPNCMKKLYPEIAEDQDDD